MSESVTYTASQIIGQKTLDCGSVHYYINNGVYQSYPLRAWGEDMLISPLDKAINRRESLRTSFWGQTCDSCDWVIKDRMHPRYETGEWVFSWNQGAYMRNLSCSFNGFDIGEIFYYEE